MLVVNRAIPQTNGELRTTRLQRCSCTCCCTVSPSRRNSSLRNTPRSSVVRDVAAWPKWPRNSRESNCTLELHAAAQAHPRDPDLNYQMGRRALQLGEVATAERHLQAALSEDPLHAASLLSLGVLRLKRIDGPEHTREAAELSELLPRLTQIARTGTELDVVANVHRVMGDRTRAEHYSDLAVAADPSCVPCLHHRAALAFQAADYERAARMQQRAVERLDEHSPTALRDLCTGALSEYQRLLSRAGSSSYRPTVVLPD